MQINGIGNMTNRLPEADGRQKEIGREQDRVLSGEQKALSAFADELLQKVGKLEDSGRNAKIAAIAARLENGTYSLDFYKLAKSMLNEGNE